MIIIIIVLVLQIVLVIIPTFQQNIIIVIIILGRNDGNFSLAVKLPLPQDCLRAIFFAEENFYCRYKIKV